VRNAGTPCWQRKLTASILPVLEPGVAGMRVDKAEQVLVLDGHPSPGSYTCRFDVAEDNHCYLFRAEGGVLHVSVHALQPKSSRPAAEVSLWYKTTALFLKDCNNELSEKAWMAQFAKRNITLKGDVSKARALEPLFLELPALVEAKQQPRGGLPAAAPPRAIADEPSADVQPSPQAAPPPPPKPPQEKAVSAPLLPSAASAPEAAACPAASPSQKLALMKKVGLASTFSVRLAAPVRNELFSKYIDEEDVPPPPRAGAPPPRLPLRPPTLPALVKGLASRYGDPDTSHAVLIDEDEEAEERAKPWHLLWFESAASPCVTATPHAPARDSYWPCRTP
jgi:hypothetical protein